MSLKAFLLSIDFEKFLNQTIFWKNWRKNKVQTIKRVFNPSNSLNQSVLYDGEPITPNTNDALVGQPHAEQGRKAVDHVTNR